jgi:hypothetical protein
VPFGLQETTFKIKGDMTKVNLYYDQDEGCVRGVKPTYGERGCWATVVQSLHAT